MTLRWPAINLFYSAPWLLYVWRQPLRLPVSRQGLASDLPGFTQTGLRPERGMILAAWNAGMKGVLATEQRAY
jgi:hypothetical protein